MQTSHQAIRLLKMMQNKPHKIPLHPRIDEHMPNNNNMHFLLVNSVLRTVRTRWYVHIAHDVRIQKYTTKQSPIKFIRKVLVLVLQTFHNVVVGVHVCLNMSTAQCLVKSLWKHFLQSEPWIEASTYWKCEEWAEKREIWTKTPSTGYRCVCMYIQCVWWFVRNLFIIFYIGIAIANAKWYLLVCTMVGNRRYVKR